MQRKKVKTEGLVRLLLSGLLLKVKQRVSFSNTQPLHDNRLVNEFEKSRNREPVCEKLHTPHDSVACRSTNNSDDLNMFLCLSHHSGRILIQLQFTVLLLFIEICSHLCRALLNSHLRISIKLRFEL